VSDNEAKMQVIQIRVPQALLDRIDRYRLSLGMRPNRSMVMRFLMESAISIIEAQEKERMR
jgi:metal-responsive CopG/Arc/MetJ family transcriptional regulator